MITVSGNIPTVGGNRKENDAVDDITPVTTLASNSKVSNLTDSLAPIRTQSNDSSFVNGKRILREQDAEAQPHTAYAWSNRKKWILLTVVALCQTSMNFNAAIYSNAVKQINEHFGITTARLGMVAFLVPYAFGCELWAPWSEEAGRWIIMQLSLVGVNMSILICALSPSFSGIITGRIIGGLSSAGGSVTLGMVADMFDADSQQHAVLWASLWSCLGAVVGGICGGPVEQFLPWRWNFYVQLMFSVATQAVHFLVAKETRTTVMLDREAKRRRKEGVEDIYGPNEVKGSFFQRFDRKEVLKTMWRPYEMLIFEPIVLFLSLLSGFADALIFSFFESYGIVFGQWGFTPVQVSLVLIPLAGSYLLAYFSFFPIVRRHAQRRTRGEVLAPESRLWWLLFLVGLLPAGLLGCAFVSSHATGHWSGIVAFSILIGMANYAIYYATVDYMVAAYGEYSASATGGNGFARDFLAGMCALYTGKMYNRLGVRNAQLVLFGLGFAFCLPVWIFYYYGPEIRERSKFAQDLAAHKDQRACGKASEKRNEQMGEGNHAQMLS